MKHVKMLDCTLRDGAYLIDKKFGDANIIGITNGLVDAGIDFVEIGFFQDEGFGEGKTVFRNSADAKRFIPKDKKNTEFTVLADYSRYSIQNLDECDHSSIDAVRECFFKKEREDALKVCRVIKEKGYKVFVQPVDILGYSDIELIQFIMEVNEIEPYCLSIVDTFGSMYQEDLHRVFEIIDHNLVSSCRIGFHSHNNMQLSNALTQEFVRLSTGRRDVVVDGTLNGMGRGAGNTPTELIVQYLNTCQHYMYDMDTLLDVIDNYMNNIRSRCTWGYSTELFVAGCYGAHVNNISYLMKKNSIRSKDIRFILNEIGSIPRKRYDYDLLENTYRNLVLSDIDDEAEIAALKETFENRDVLIVCPGATAATELDKIRAYIAEKTPVVICVNYVDQNIEPDHVFMSNVRRYDYWKNVEGFEKYSRILLSGIKHSSDDPKEHIISLRRLIKLSWKYVDNALIMLLRFLDNYEPASIAIAGLDGYASEKNYASPELELRSVCENPVLINEEISEMIRDFMSMRAHRTKTFTLTTSRFAGDFSGH